MCLPEEIEFIYGGVFMDNDTIPNIFNKQYYKVDKTNLDVCFVASKYSPKGKDKGYDLFIESAKILVTKCDNIHFHVIGGFNKNDMNIDGLESNITFYGYQLHNFLDDFYKKMDIIVSPNRPFVLSLGSFDGFPTGCCIEAGMNGVAVICSDELKLNEYFENSRNIELIPNNVEAIVKIITYYYKHPRLLMVLSKNCYKRFNKVFSPTKQLEKRLDLLTDYLSY
jgi:glycosyltransferase involved in cell wall biosynthesis